MGSVGVEGGCGPAARFTLTSSSCCSNQRTEGSEEREAWWEWEAEVDLRRGKEEVRDAWRGEEVIVNVWRIITIY